MNQQDADATNDFAKFLYQSEDTQIDTQTSSETSDLKDDSYDILVAKVGEKDEGIQLVHRSDGLSLGERQTCPQD
jgi:hypothetical protein